MNSRTAEKLVNGNIEVTIPICIRRESNLVTLDRLPETPKTEWQRLAPLQRRLVLGFHLLDKCEENPSKSSVAIAKICRRSLLRLKSRSFLMSVGMKRPIT